jgi:hypothetical protein
MIYNDIMTEYPIILSAENVCEYKNESLNSEIEFNNLDFLNPNLTNPQNSYISKPDISIFIIN